MSLNFNGSCIGGIQGGGSITVDSALSDISTNPVQNKVLYPSLSGFLPSGTIINVKTDGTGDFTKLSDAINYLTGKWSNGEVTIQLGDGTFNETSQITIDRKNFSIPRINIFGNGISSTIIQWTTTPTYMITAFGCLININGLTMQRETRSNNRGVVSQNGCNMYLTNVKVANTDYGICAMFDGNVTLNSSITVENGNNAFVAEIGGHITSSYMCPITITSCTTGFLLSVGGFINLGYVTPTFTSVTNKTNGTKNAATSDGYITGITNL